MIALSLPEIKDFMNKLLCTDTFGHFLLKEAVILGSVTWSLDGTIQPDFYSSDEAMSDVPFVVLKSAFFLATRFAELSVLPLKIRIS